jgi:hypothetical protein
MANSFKRAVSASVGTSAVSVYTCPAATEAVMHAIYIGNKSGGAITVDVQVDVGATLYSIGTNLPINSGGTLVLDKPVNLNATDILKITSDTAASADVFCSVLEVS